MINYTAEAEISASAVFILQSNSNFYIFKNNG